MNEAAVEGRAAGPMAVTIVYPQRPGEQECQFYMKTGTCKYAQNCKFHHPPDVTPTFGPIAPATDITIGLNKEHYPRRAGEQPCSYFLRTATCKYKMSCKFDHPPDAVTQTLQLQNAPFPMRPGEPPCAFYIKTGKCKFGATCRFDHPPLGPEQAAAAMMPTGYQQMPEHRAGMSMGHMGPMSYPYGPPDTMTAVMMQQQQQAAAYNSLPQRPGDKECTFFLKTGRCQYGPRCKFHHPLDKIPQGVMPMANGMQPMGFPGAMPVGVDSYGYTPQDQQLPVRPGQEPCSYYMRTGKCSYGLHCKFDHPRPGSAGPDGNKSSEGLNGDGKYSTAPDGSRSMRRPGETSPSAQGHPASPQSGYGMGPQQSPGGMQQVSSSSQPGVAVPPMGIPQPSGQVMPVSGPPQGSMPPSVAQQPYANGHASMHGPSPYGAQQPQYGMYDGNVAAGAMYQNGSDYSQQQSQQQQYGMYPAPNAYTAGPASYAMYRTAT